MLSKNQKNDSFEVYLGAKDYHSSSDFRNIMISPRHYQYEKERIDEKESEALMLGSATHCLVLEPSEFSKRYQMFDRALLPFPDKDYKTKANREARDFYVKDAKEKGIVIIQEPQFEMIKQMSESVKSNRAAMKIFENTITEQSFYLDNYVFDDEFSFKAKVRPDAISNDGTYYVSLKTCMDASPKAFTRQIFSLDYHISETYYMKVLRKCTENKIKRGYIVAIEKKAPYLCSVFDTNSEAENGNLSEFLQLGNHVLGMAIQRLKEAKLTNVYKGYEIESDNEFGILPIIVPKYAMSEASNLII